MAFLRIKFTVPDLSKIVLTPEQVVDRAITAVDKVVDSAEQDWNNLVQTWTHKPTYHRTPATLKGGVVSGSVYSTDKNLIRLNNGTPAHQFGHGKVMSFHPKYTPKTTPGMIKSFPGGKPKGKKGRIVRRGPFKSRGIRPRLFDIAIKREHERDLNDFGKQLKP